MEEKGELGAPTATLTACALHPVLLADEGVNEVVGDVVGGLPGIVNWTIALPANFVLLQALTPPGS